MVQRDLDELIATTVADYEERVENDEPFLLLLARQIAGNPRTVMAVVQRRTHEWKGFALGEDEIESLLAISEGDD